ncbi:MAG: hypothetical protein M1831_002536 [Alyxoria varia]|nr:MAG: hypothetical protein M1831_002536 [Alyxoria varia]
MKSNSTKKQPESESEPSDDDQGDWVSLPTCSSYDDEAMACSSDDESEALLPMKEAINDMEQGKQQRRRQQQQDVSCEVNTDKLMDDGQDTADKQSGNEQVTTTDKQSDHSQEDVKNREEEEACENNPKTQDVAEEASNNDFSSQSSASSLSGMLGRLFRGILAKCRDAWENYYNTIITNNKGGGEVSDSNNSNNNNQNQKQNQNRQNSGVRSSAGSATRASSRSKVVPVANVILSHDLLYRLDDDEDDDDAAAAAAAAGAESQRGGDHHHRRIDPPLSERDMQRITYYTYLSQEVEHTLFNTFLCFPCNAFHPSVTSGGGNRRGTMLQHPGCPATDLTLKVGPVLGGNLSFWWAHAMIRADRLGTVDSTGAPSNPTEVSHTVLDGWDWIWCSWVNWNQRMLVRSDSLSEEISLRASEGQHHHHHDKMPRFVPACAHSDNCAGLRRVVSETLASARSGADFQAGSDLFRCQWCPSEYRVGVGLFLTSNPDGSYSPLWLEDSSSSGGEEPDAYQFVVTQWLDLGKCLSPESREWVTLTRPAPSARHQPTVSGGQCESRPFSLMGLPTVESRVEDETESVQPRTWPC